MGDLVKLMTFIQNPSPNSHILGELIGEKYKINLFVFLNRPPFRRRVLEVNDYSKIHLS